MDIPQLIKKHRILSEQIREDELKVLLNILKTVLNNNVAGDVVELGCYEGTSALFFGRMLQAMSPERTLWLYDSFEGLPAKTDADETPLGELFVEGALKASKSTLLRNFIKAGLPQPEVTKAWFHELEPDDLPSEIAFAFLDGDFYESITTSLELVWPHLSKGAVVVVDDYQNVKLPGAKKAVDEWLNQQQIKGFDSKASLGILYS